MSDRDEVAAIVQRITPILPPDPWWLLKVNIGPGEPVPFKLWMLWAAQYCRPVNKETA